MRFHQRLIAKGHARGVVELLQVRAGSRSLGYLYQFCYRGRVLAYQSAYPSCDDNRRRLGLVMHCLAVERAGALGHSLYDFLAGEARYKRSLGREEQKLMWLRLQRPRLLFGLERGARRVKAAMRPWFATAPAASAPGRDWKDRRPA
jgi:CelD/BcsL family acetyltransferase involved in cellulose biosynthesis